MTASMQAHEGRTEWTSPAEVTDLVLALASGELDAWSGRMVRAGLDTAESLRARAAAGLRESDRTITLRALGSRRPPRLAPSPRRGDRVCIDSQGRV